MAHLPLEALIISNFTIVGNPETGQKRAPTPPSRLPARVVSGTFRSAAHAEDHWLAASGTIKIYYATVSSKCCMARLAYLFSGRIV